MPEHPQSTPAVPIATPPRIPPASWEDYPVFRETFLLYFTEPPANAALRVTGRLLHDMTLEYYHHWPNWPEGTTATELRAALADLRHLEGYLGAVGREHLEAALSEADADLSRLAARSSAELARIAHQLEAALGREV